MYISGCWVVKQLGIFQTTFRTVSPTRLCDFRVTSNGPPGQYPPAIQPFINKRRNFAQLEDFNKGGKKSAYTKHIERNRGEL